MRIPQARYFECLLGSGALEAQLLLPSKCGWDEHAGFYLSKGHTAPFSSPFPEACMNSMKSLLPVKYDPIGYFQLRINGKTDGAVI